MRSIQTWLRYLMLWILYPFFRNPFFDRGKWFLFSRINPRPGSDLDWKHFGVRECRMRGGSRILCDFRHSADRLVFFTGEYEILLTRFIRRVVSSRWRFIDVGANVGKYTVMAARICGEVISVEPNPESRHQLETNLRLNGFENVQVLPFALSETTGSLSLSQRGEDIGGASLRHIEGSTAQHAIRVVPGDSLIKPDGRPVYLKIDVEGFEQYVLRGFEKLLGSSTVIVQAEITDDWLRSVGGAASELFRFLESFGLYPYLVTRQSRIRTRPRLQRISGPLNEFQYDAVFLPHKSEDLFWEWVFTMKREEQADQ